MQTAKAHEHDRITIGNRQCNREDALAVLNSRLEAAPKFVRDTTRVPLGVYRGLKFGLILHPQFSPDVYLEGAASRQSGFLSESRGPRAILNAVERLANAYKDECERTERDLGIAEGQLRDYQARLGQPFEHEAYLSELATLRDQLKIALSGMAPQPDAEMQPTASDLAERIKTLKAAHTALATPERVLKHRPAAEEPVTSRIRRRIEAAPATDPAPISAVAGHSLPPAASGASTPERPFQERFAADRGNKELQLTSL